MDEPKFEVPASTLGAVSNYLMDRPYREVAQLMNLLAVVQMIPPAEPTPLPA